MMICWRSSGRHGQADRLETGPSPLGPHLRWRHWPESATAAPPEMRRDAISPAGLFATAWVSHLPSRNDGARPARRAILLGMFVPLNTCFRTLIAWLAVAAVAAGCATRAAPEGPESVGEVEAALELAPPDRGFQLETLGVTVDAGDDIRWCEVLQVPGTPGTAFVVDRLETALGGHGLDLVLTAATPGSPTEAILDAGARVPCLRAGEAFGEDLRTITSTQHHYHDQRYPDGVGQRFEGGQKLVLEYHYENASSEPVVARAKINFHLASPEGIRHHAHTATFDNLTIYTPPLGQSSHLAECAVTEPLLVGELVRRTRSWGTHFRVWIRGGERDGELVWHSSDHRDTNLELDEPIVLGPGEGFRFQCSYFNGSPDELRFGTGAADEVCTLQAIYWSQDPMRSPSQQECLLLGVDDDGVAR